MGTTAPRRFEQRAGVLGERLLGRDADLIQLAGGTDRWGRAVADQATVSATAVATAASTALPPLGEHGEPRRRRERKARGDAIGGEDRRIGG
jgi:hypothetical protein